jgi:hypothetical protein
LTAVALAIQDGLISIEDLYAFNAKLAGQRRENPVTR